MFFFLLSGHLNIRSFPHAIFDATCLHFRSKNLPKSQASWGVWGASWGPLGASWASWSVLGSSWSVLEASWSVLGASWSVLGSSWSVLERLRGVLERLGRVLQRPKFNYVTGRSRFAPLLGRRELTISLKKKAFCRKTLYRKPYI